MKSSEKSHLDPSNYENGNLTSLHVAAYDLDIATTYSLIKEGANIFMEDPSGSNALHIVITSKKYNCFQKSLEKTGLITLFCNMNPDIINYPNSKNGDTPLSLAIKCKDDLSIMALRSLGADISPYIETEKCSAMQMSNENAQNTYYHNLSSLRSQYARLFNIVENPEKISNTPLYTLKNTTSDHLAVEVHSQNNNIVPPGNNTVYIVQAYPCKGKKTDSSDDLLKSVSYFVEQVSPYIDNAIKSLSEVFLGDSYHKTLAGEVNADHSDIS